MPLIAKTGRLLIRTWNIEDVPALCELTRQEGLSEFSTSGYSNYSEEKALSWIQNEIHRYENYRLGKFAVISKELNITIGISGLFQGPPPSESEIELNYRFPRQYRGQGFATEAAQAVLNYGFNVLGLSRINANADLNNFASHAVLKRLGMKLVGEVEYEGIKAGRWSIGNERTLK